MNKFSIYFYFFAGESEVRQAYLRKSEYLCKIGDKDAAVASFRQTYEKTVGIGNRIDLIFNLIRLGLFFLDHQLINTNIAKAKSLMEMVTVHCKVVNSLQSRDIKVLPVRQSGSCTA